jgi:hypothetical protein
MFYTYQDREEDFKNSGQKDTSGRTSRPESTSTARDDDIEALERVATQEDHESCEEEIDNEKRPNASSSRKETGKPSLELRQTASNVLTRVLTTRSIRDPPPPPDGGFKAWLQVAMGWLIIFVTWGFVNSFGAFQSYYTDQLDRLDTGVPHLFHRSFFWKAAGCGLVCAYAFCGWRSAVAGDFHDESFDQVVAVAAEPGGADRHWGRDIFLPEYGVDCDVLFGSEGVGCGDCFDGEFSR